METTTAREFNQQSAKVLAAAEHGQAIAVTKNGRHIATLVPVGQAEPVPPYPTDPMGDEDDLPLFDGPADLSARVDELLAEGFGE
ncbi:type II toxin-antitoxin system Phd/YefM family antitoxin [Streptomyces sp. NPDC001339]|uniref:type II toxin-antitoxin system Phd/YefM family antitoxin n=1 Tax=Streptomyces sp. NPDC001339 TaxID=3364563 RepID=UPI00368D8778